ncbi:hypothetical protein OB955_13050 [Halobacteria archaeon AArc-m2/3/4]|uniref:Uncharacterized protein n=1 Tax=Natronoglomus mannanivorans TaxID=2979990 RepID=A0ABT2QFF8_9EURY|nr:hypothetical protein [Halobacteria archaeon AArc-m2/3/4]
MKRRSLLAAIGSATAASNLAGCLADDSEWTPDAGGGDGDDDGSTETENGPTNGSGSDGNGDESDDNSADRTDEQCDRTVVWYNELPADVAAEVDAALEDGAYETDGELYYAQAIDVEAVSLEVDDTYYAAEIEEEGETTVFRLEETIPTKSAPEELAFRNATDDELTVSVTVTPADGDEVLLEEESIELDPDVTAYEGPRFPVTDEYGTYDVALETADGRSESLTWTIEYVSFDGVVVLEDDDAFVAPEAVMEVAPCPWS